MKTIKSTGQLVWVLFYQWGENSPTWWGAYDSLEALLFDFDKAYHDIADNSTDDLTTKEIARAKKELREEACTENKDLGLYMNIDRIMLYTIGEDES